MATQRVPALQFPSQPPAQLLPVSQDKLRHILELRRQLDSLEKQLGEAQDDVKAALEVGAAVEPGLFQASLRVSERTNVSWKSVVERELGSGYAQRVLAATKPDRYVKLIVTA